ncbi:hypothetical protein L9F63_020749, partial [Diploptera punctata]
SLADFDRTISNLISVPGNLTVFFANLSCFLRRRTKSFALQSYAERQQAKIYNRKHTSLGLNEFLANPDQNY